MTLTEEDMRGWMEAHLRTFGLRSAIKLAEQYFPDEVTEVAQRGYDEVSGLPDFYKNKCSDLVAAAEVIGKLDDLRERFRQYTKDVNVPEYGAKSHNGFISTLMELGLEDDARYLVNRIKEEKIKPTLASLDKLVERGD